MKTTIAADSNVVISALLEWHQFNSRAYPAIQKALAEDDLLISIDVRNTWRFLAERDMRTSGAQRFLTFNPKHFAPFADRIEIVVPG